jgi:hypothetical protein
MATYYALLATSYYTFLVSAAPLLDLEISVDNQDTGPQEFVWLLSASAPGLAVELCQLRFK